MTTIEEVRAASHLSVYNIPCNAVREYGREAIVAAMSDDLHNRSDRVGRGLVHSVVQWLRSATAALVLRRSAPIASPGGETIAS